jgi:diguanylate cyclase
MTSNPEGKQVRVLLVEDDWVDAKAITRAVSAKALSYTIDGATSIARARAKLAAGSYDVVILDNELSDGSGLDLLPAIGDTPAIVLTGSGSERVAAKALRLGADDYLVKDPARNYLGKLPDVVEGVITRRSPSRRELREQLLALEGLLAGILADAGAALADLPAASVAREPIERVVGSGRRAADLVGQLREP